MDQASMKQVQESFQSILWFTVNIYTYLCTQQNHWSNLSKLTMKTVCVFMSAIWLFSAICGSLLHFCIFGCKQKFVWVFLMVLLGWCMELNKPRALNIQLPTLFVILAMWTRFPWFFTAVINNIYTAQLPLTLCSDFKCCSSNAWVKIKMHTNAPKCCTSNLFMFHILSLKFDYIMYVALLTIVHYRTNVWNN